MDLLALAFALTLSASIGLGYVRYRSKRGERPRSLQVLAACSAFGAGIALCCVVLWVLPGGGWFAGTTYPLVAAQGASMGVILIACVRFLLIEFPARLWHWSCRRPREIERTNREFLATSCLLLVGAGAAFAIVFVTIHALAPYGSVALLLPFFFALLPMYETLILPWFQYARAPTLATEGLPELETWVENLRLEHDLPRFRVRIQNGPFNNAFAIGGLGASLIVVGKGLVDRLSEPHLKAIVAHELAHVARRDVPWLIPPVAIATTLFSISLVTVSNPLFATFEVWGFASGALLAGLSYWVLILSIPGFFMRRMEFGADRLAADLLGESETLAQALERLSEITGQPLTKRTWSHPATQARIAALRSPLALKRSKRRWGLRDTG